MCKKPYYGWRCGHPDLSATELPVDPCGPPVRYSYEPLCSPLVYELIVRKVPEDDEEDNADARWLKSQINLCAECAEILALLAMLWEAKKIALRHEGTATEGDLWNIEAQLDRHATAALEKARVSGPYHTVHVDEFESGQQAIFREVDHMLEELQEAKSYFRTQFDLIESKGLIHASTLQEYRRRYARAERRQTALNTVQVMTFRDQITQLIQELSMKHVALELRGSGQKAAAAHESPDENPFGEAPPEAEAQLFDPSPSAEAEPEELEAEPELYGKSPAAEAEPEELEAEPESYGKSPAGEVEPEAKAKSFDPNSSGEAEQRILSEAAVFPGTGLEVEAESLVETREEAERRMLSPAELFPQENPTGEAIQQILSAAAIQNPHAEPTREIEAESEAEAGLLDETREAIQQILSAAAIQNPHAEPTPEIEAESEAEAGLLDENREAEEQILAQAELFPPNPARGRGRGRGSGQRGGYRAGLRRRRARRGRRV